MKLKRKPASNPFRKTIIHYASLFDAMKANGFISNPDEQVEEFVASLTGEKWFSNIYIEFKIISDFNGHSELVNFRKIKDNDVMAELFKVA